MRVAFSVSAGAAWLLAAAPAAPHHSFAAVFDITRPVEFTGTITRIEWTNPHAWIYVAVADADGNVGVARHQHVAQAGLDTRHSEARRRRQRGRIRREKRQQFGKRVRGHCGRHGRTALGERVAGRRLNRCERLWGIS